MNKKVKWTLIILVSLLVLFFILKLVSGSGDKEIKVSVSQTVRTTIIETVNAPGKVFPEVEVKISSDVSGEITELNVQEGDSVRKGQVLARIYADIYASERDAARARVVQSQATVANSQASLESLKAQLDQVKQAYNRNKQLYDEKVISKSEFEVFETNLRTAQASYNAALQNIRSLQANTESVRTTLDAANKNLGRTTLIAPMDGVISSLSVKKGERVSGNSFSVGPEMMRVADLSNMEVRVNVGENDIVKVNIGDSADVEIEAYNNRKFIGIVTQIASSTLKSGAAAGSSLTGDVTDYEVRIRLLPGSYNDLIDPARPKNFPFRPGMNASADIKTKTKSDVVAVPIGAVGTRIKGSEEAMNQEKDKKEEENIQPGTVVAADDELEEVVFIVKPDNTVEKRVITTGIQDMNYYEVLTGLKEGEQVVTLPYDAVTKFMKSGDAVKVVPREKLY
ncbi:MAG: efflux RND transporter periplasmic adaptor subunit [Flavisolibacter sp.]